MQALAQEGYAARNLGWTEQEAYPLLNGTFTPPPIDHDFQDDNARKPVASRIWFSAEQWEMVQKWATAYRLKNKQLAKSDVADCIAHLLETSQL